MVSGRKKRATDDYVSLNIYEVSLSTVKVEQVYRQNKPLRRKNSPVFDMC